MKENNIKMKPFVKWVGGKSQVLDIINLLKPKEINKFIEPFVGGGAVFFNFAYNKAIINDINKELITTYEVIRDDSNDLINILDNWNNSQNLKDFYQELKFKDVNNLTKKELAARFIFLNKYGFNGIYRVNSKGQFNVPFANKSKTNLYDNTNITNIANYLKNNEIKILNNNYNKLLKSIEPGDFLFVDPPYYFSDSKNFNSYDVNKFTEQDQKKLLNFLKKAEKKGANWLLTNNDHPFIRKLYKNYFYFSVKTNRFINSNGQNRINAANELFVLNYKLRMENEKMLPKEAQNELQFNNFLDTFIDTNIKLDDFVDWEKVNSKIKSYRQDLSIFNFLQSENEEILKEKINKYWFQNLSSFQKFYILLAGRESNAFLQNKESRFFKDLIFRNPNEVIEFLKESNLIRLFIGKNKIDFTNYLLGIEVGLDSNARKNRFGTIMENNIAQILKENNIEFVQNYSVDFVKDRKGNKKIFDFKFSKNNKDYYLECNFFNSSGSKINEVTKSYRSINEIFKKEKDINFIWVTDGAGWKKTKSSLKTAFFDIENLFSIKLFKEWINAL